MVECESDRNYSSGSVVLVLIDTWWNVNVIAPTGISSTDKVLIDTWWNVNL